METLRGYFLVPSIKNADQGLWFIFHHEADGILAMDLTTAHPDIPMRHFAMFHGTPVDTTPLLGGPMQDDTALVVLHNDPAAGQDSHHINRDFHFISRRFVLVPGAKPQIVKADDSAGDIEFTPSTRYLVTLGFRLWDMDALEDGLKNWQWTLLPASSDIVFHTKREDRLKRARLSTN